MVKQTERKLIIAPSMLSCDFSRIAEEIRDIESAGADFVHVDVMDGHFVPNLTIGAPVVKWIRKVTKLPLDAHLMIDEPKRYIEDFRKAGSDWITVHVEATAAMDETLKLIQGLGAKVGMSLRPGTPVEKLEPYLDRLDLILVMTVEPGFGGQSFMPDMLDKVRTLRPKFKGLLSVDGGITAQYAAQAIEAGANVLVAGTAIFGRPDRKKAIQEFRDAGLK